jgi:hypothetical protein
MALTELEQLEQALLNAQGEQAAFGFVRQYLIQRDRKLTVTEAITKAYVDAGIVVKAAHAAKKGWFDFGSKS